jgi:MFS family permease
MLYFYAALAKCSAATRQQGGHTIMLWPRLKQAGRTLFIPPQTSAERNVYFLYTEILFAAVLGATGAFNSTYVLRLGGSNTLVGLLSSLPSLLAIFLFIPSAQILERQKNVMPWVVKSLFFSRIGYAIIPLLPLLLPGYLPEVTLGILVLMVIPSVLFSTSWSPLLVDVVPARARATVLSWRSILNSAMVAPLIYLAGRWLEAQGGIFPANYQWMYAVGVLGGIYSVYLVSRITLPPKPAAETPTPTAVRAPWWQGLMGTLRDNPRLARIIANTFLFDFAAWMVGPLYIIFFVRQLGATDGWVGLHSMLAHIGVIVGFWLWQRIIRRIGEARSLLVALPLASAYAFMVALVPNLAFINLAAFLINVINPGVSLSHSVIFLDLLPEGKRHSSTAIYSTVMHIGAFVAPLIGVALSDRIGIPTTLLIGGSMRLLGAFTFWLFPIIPPRPVGSQQK